MKKTNTYKGIFPIKNKEKYVGTKQPTYRSSWEYYFMSFLDNNPNILGWASESITIPYYNPLKNTHTVYVPDFFVVLLDKNKKKRILVIEIKPEKEVTMEHAKTKYDKFSVVQNHAKWKAASLWCKKHGFEFHIMTEKQLFTGKGITR